jgi:anti-sigma factor RsiW
VTAIDPTTGHLSTDAVADQVDGLLDAAEAGTVATHLTDCAFCRQRVDELRVQSAEVLEILRTLPPVEMPPGFAARIDAAIAATASPHRPASTVVPLARPASSSPASRSARTASWVAVAAGVALIAAVGVSVVASHDPGSTASTGALGAAAAPALLSVEHSGTTYSAASIKTSVPSLLGHASAAALTPAYDSIATAAPATTPTPSNAPSGTTADQYKSMAGLAGAYPFVASQTTLAACVHSLIDPAHGDMSPLAIDLGSFRRVDGSKPAVVRAAVVVLPSSGEPNTVEVWVVGRSCSSADPQLLYWTRISNVAASP